MSYPKTRLCLQQGRTVHTCVEFYGMKKKKKLHLKIKNPFPYIFLILFGKVLLKTCEDETRKLPGIYPIASTSSKKDYDDFDTKKFKPTPHPPDNRVILPSETDGAYLC